MVAGHSTFVGSDLEDVNGFDEVSYLQGHAKYFQAHIRKGVEAVQEDDKALLLVSGYVTLFCFKGHDSKIW